MSGTHSNSWDQCSSYLGTTVKAHTESCWQKQQPFCFSGLGKFVFRFFFLNFSFSITALPLLHIVYFTVHFSSSFCPFSFPFYYEFHPTFLFSIIIDLSSFLFSFTLENFLLTGYLWGNKQTARFLSLRITIMKSHLSVNDFLKLYA